MPDALILEGQFDDSQIVGALKRVDAQFDTTAKKGQTVATGLSAVDQAFAKLAANSTSEIDTLSNRTIASLDAIEREWKQNASAATESAKATEKATAATVKSTQANSQMSMSLSEVAGYGRKLAAVFGITLGAGAIVQYANSAAQAASATVDLAQQLDVSIEYAQRMKFAADQSRMSVDVFGRAMFTLSNNIADGGKQVDQALSAIHLSVQQLTGLSQEQQIDRVIHGLAGLTDAQARNRAGSDLLGMSYREIAKQVKEIPGLMDRASVASENAVKNVDEAQKRLDAWWARRKTQLIGVLSDSVEGNVTKHRTDLPTRSSEFGQDISIDLPPPPPDYLARVQAADAAIQKLTRSQRDNIDAGLATGRTLADLGKEYHLTADEQVRYVQVAGELKKGEDEHAENMLRARQIFADIQKAAADGADQLHDYNEQWHRLPPFIMDAAGAAQTYIETITPHNQDFSGFLPGLDKWEGFVDNIKPATDAATDWGHALSETADEFARLAQISDGAMSRVVRSIGTGISAVAQMESALKRLQSTSTSTMDKIGSGFSILTAPVAIADTIGGRNNIKEQFDNLNYLKAQLNDLFGSYQNAQRAAESLGATGQHLWDQLTAPNHKISETQKILQQLTHDLDANRTATESLLEIINQANFDAEQAGRTGLDAVLMNLQHEKDLAIRALAQYAAGDAALYQQAVEAVSRKYDALANQAIKEDADRMASQTQNQVDELARISGLLDGIKRHTDAEIAGLGAFSTGGDFYNAVIARIQGRQTAADLSQLGRAGGLVAPAAGGVTLSVSVGQILVQADQSNPDFARQLGQSIIDEARAKGQRM